MSTILDLFQYKKSVVQLKGIQSHGRSIIVWPKLLDDESTFFLRALVGYGIRMIVFGEAIELDIWPGKIEPYDLQVMQINNLHSNYTTHKQTIESKTIFDLQNLQRECGLTPLPDFVYNNQKDWQHHMIYADQSIVATASLQKMKYSIASIEEPVSLICSVLVKPEYQHNGFGRTVVKDILKKSSTPSSIALVESSKDSNSLGFFEDLGWKKTMDKAQFIQWK
ncbi:TPA: GNAT family N-acetyltransferase [Bacillus tropicus]|nr:GNAT family N-acetyltransferase [Bacillus tropicus]